MSLLDMEIYDSSIWESQSVSFKDWSILSKIVNIEFLQCVKLFPWMPIGLVIILFLL